MVCVQLERPSNESGTKCISIAIVDRLLFEVIFQGMHDSKTVSAVQHRLSHSHIVGASRALSLKEQVRRYGNGRVLGGNDDLVQIVPDLLIHGLRRRAVEEIRHWIHSRIARYRV